MTNSNSIYSSYLIEPDEALEISRELYGIEGEISTLPGELDFNFMIRSRTESYVLKIIRPGTKLNSLQFRQAILEHFRDIQPDFVHPESFPDKNGKHISEITDKAGNSRYVRLLSWIDGRIWSSVNPKKYELLFSLGEQAGSITKALDGFSHNFAERELDWDISQGEWTFEASPPFSDSDRSVISHFHDRFRSIQKEYTKLRKSVVHNDGNDNNIIVSDDLIDPVVTAIIDYGDSVYTQIINDLAITMAYSIMGKTDPLGAALNVVEGYHSKFPLKEKELKFLFTLVAMRLIISITKSAINKREEPDNKYLLISEEPALALLKKMGDYK